MLNDLYFKTTCNIRPHFLGPMGGLKIEVSLYLLQARFLFDLWKVARHVSVTEENSGRNFKHLPGD